MDAGGGGVGVGGAGAEEAVDEADDFGEVGAADGGADLGGEGGEGLDLVGVGGVVALDGGGEVLVAEVEDGEADVLGLFGDAGADEGAAEGDAAAAGGEDLVGVAVEVEAEELAVLGVGAEDGADGVVGADGFEADAHAGDVAAIDFGAVADLGDVALCALARMSRNCCFEGDAGCAEELGGELEDAAGVGDDLDGLDAGDLVEEPAAGGVHELGVAFELEELEGGDALGGDEGMGGVIGEEVGRGGGLRSRTTWM